MEICMEKFLGCISAALDTVEGELLGASTHHGKRIAIISSAMGRYLQLGEAEESSLASCALLHDNALTEYILSEQPGKDQELNMRIHCEYGERNAAMLPFRTDVTGYILYHHERADGDGPMEKKEGEFPQGAALIAAADMVDAESHLQNLPLEDLAALRENIAKRAGTQFTQQATQALLGVLDEEMLLSLRNSRIDQTFEERLPCWNVVLDNTAVIRMAGVIARIIDYKSEFTRSHSIQIANKAWHMAGVYGFDAETQAKLYLAGALHDIGKLKTPLQILEKPGALTVKEFDIIKQHSYWTNIMLKDVVGLEDVCCWATNHHRKLDGSGYPGIQIDVGELDFESRLLACLDIYQGVREERPYHNVRSHDEAMEVLNDMARDGKIDSEIVGRLGVELAKYSDGCLPSPPGAIEF